MQPTVHRVILAMKESIPLQVDFAISVLMDKSLTIDRLGVMIVAADMSRREVNALLAKPVRNLTKKETNAKLAREAITTPILPPLVSPVQVDRVLTKIVTNVFLVPVVTLRHL